MNLLNQQISVEQVPTTRLVNIVLGTGDIRTNNIPTQIIVPTVKGKTNLLENRHKNKIIKS